MAQQNNDDVARALAALAGGAVPSEHETPSSGIPSESTVFDSEPVATPAKPAAKPLFSPNALPPAASPPGRPATVRPAAVAPSASSNPQATAQSAPPPKAPRSRATPQPVPVTPAPLPPMPELPPLAKIRPSTNSKRPTAPTRPQAPTATPPPSPAAALLPLPESTRPTDDLLSEITEDDEMIAPAPDLSAFTPKARVVVSKKHLYEQTNFRRTIIPILLTGGVILIALGAWSQLDRSGILGGLGGGIVALFITLGVVLIALGVLNMLHVKQILEADGASKV